LEYLSNVGSLIEAEKVTSYRLRSKSLASSSSDISDKIPGGALSLLTPSLTFFFFLRVPLLATGAGFFASSSSSSTP
jgi:hypothetical protein